MIERLAIVSERERTEARALMRLRDSLSRVAGGEVVPDVAIRESAAVVSQQATALAEKGVKNAERAVRSTLKPFLAKLPAAPVVSEKTGYDTLVEAAPSADSDAVRKATYGRDLPPLRT